MTIATLLRCLNAYGRAVARNSLLDDATKTVILRACRDQARHLAAFATTERERALVRSIERIA